MRYYITGKVLPERVNYWLSDSITKSDPDFGSITLKCDASQITVIMDTHLDEKSAYIFAGEFAVIIVNSFGFANACGYTVEMTTICSENQNMNVYGVQVIELKYDDSELNKVFNETLDLSFKDVLYRFAIRDYLNAIIRPLECGFLCYRAVETIKNRFGSNDGGWVAMHQSLGTDKEKIMHIKSFADPIRHGNYFNFKPTDAGVRVAILREAKEVIEKYQSYILGMS